MAKKSDKLSKRSADNPHLLRSRDIGARQQTFSHPWNPNSEITGVMMGRMLGLKRLGVSIARIAPGKESFVPHTHHREEEWLYILMGLGRALIGEDEIDVGAGDFMAFPTPSVTHHLTNIGAEDLVYLMGGENLDVEISDFPTVGRRVVRMNGQATVYDLADGKPFGAPPPGKKSKKKKSKKG